MLFVFEVCVGPGDSQEVERHAAASSRVVVSFEVQQGQWVRGYDVDFGVVLIPSPETADDPDPIRLFGPCRRATSLTACMDVPMAGRVVLNFDNSGMWLTSKVVQCRLQITSDPEAI